MSPVQMEGIVAMLRTVELIESGLLVAAIVTAAHYLFKRGDPRPENWHLLVRRYVWGTLAIGIPYLLTCIKYEEWKPLAAYAVLVGVAGGTTTLLYLLDRDQLAHQRGKDLESAGLPDGSTD